jgi:hypothetical protein
MAVLNIESEGLSPAQAYEKVRGVKDALLHIFQTAEAEGISPDAAARRIAQARLR